MGFSQQVLSLSVTKIISCLRNNESSFFVFIAIIFSGVGPFSQCILCVAKQRPIFIYISEIWSLKYWKPVGACIRRCRSFCNCKEAVLLHCIFINFLRLSLTKSPSLSSQQKTVMVFKMYNHRVAETVIKSLRPTAILKIRF